MSGPVAALPVPVPRHLPRDRRHIPAQPRRDLPHRLTPGQPQRDLLPLTEPQVTPLQITTSARAHPAGLPQPRQTPMPVGLRNRRRISQKLTGLQRRPKRLNSSATSLFENRIVINTLPESSGVATTARTRGTLYGSEQNQGQQRAATTSRPSSD